MSSELLPIVADTPSERPGMGFGAYGEAIAAAIRGGRPAQFTVGIYGSWGSGKSSLLNAVRVELAKDPGVLAVPFDAWRYERADHIVVPMLNAIYNASPELNDRKLTEKVRSALASVVRSVTISLGPVKFDPGAAFVSVGDDERYADALNSAYVRPYQDLHALTGALGDRRIVVLVDDLDRCSPDKVVSLLEAINLVLDVPGFVFVLALDYDVLVRAVTAKYPHASGHVFIEKMVQVPFRVPRLDIRPEVFLDELVPGWRPPDDDFSAIAYDVATLGLAVNPRQVKRFINSFLLLLRIAGVRAITASPRLIAGLVGLQLRWPAEYQDVANAVYAEDNDPLAVLQSTDQPELGRYATAFFKPAPRGEELRAVMHLTETVAQPEAFNGFYPAETVSAQELRDVATAEIRAALVSKGFTESARAAGIYVHRDLPYHRVRIAKTVVRFEVKDTTGRWVLGVSIWLSKALPEAIELIDDFPKLRRVTSAGASATHSTIAQEAMT
ncbi:P-loop NTPase fold protein [Kribbella sp. NPDC026611]|uniref:KAP family P-loop NTPase fold protein n=1 Tax=Kribbella sp. NPDC026611 TaxID=3154911 RepID=UPI0033F334C2